MNHRAVPFCILMVLWTTREALPALTPEQQRWEDFIVGHSVPASLPEDERLGPLVDMRSPDPESREAIRICESIFAELSEGTLPSARFHPAVRGLLNFTFSALLAKGPRRAVRRYGRPVRKGPAVTVPVRAEGGDEPSYGHIYLRLAQGEWYVDQWSLDLSGLPPAGPGQAAPIGIRPIMRPRSPAIPQGEVSMISPPFPHLSIDISASAGY